jgi:hypothetical protein
MSRRGALLMNLVKKRSAALLNQGKLPEVKRSRALAVLKEAARPVPRVTRLRALIGEAVKPAKRQFVVKSTTRYYDRKGRRFFVTMRNSYVVRRDETSLYGRKAFYPIRKLSAVPFKIRPKRLPKAHKA